MKPIDIPIAQFSKAYFIGIGGIGMSALARYFHSRGLEVGGYDKVSTVLTQQLKHEGIFVSHTDALNRLPDPFDDAEKTLVVYTPAIPTQMGELNYVQGGDFHVYKRAQVLGMITRDSKALCVAGTHGKTTTSTMLAHMLQTSALKCNAFLGGISTNFASNFVSDEQSEYTVIEADEFDRSFLQLTPFATIITSTDADHLDIYGSNDEFLEGFQRYADLVSDQGFTIQHADIRLQSKNCFTYGIDINADYAGSNLHVENSAFVVNVQTPHGKMDSVVLGIPGIHNAENAIACIAMCQQLGLDESTIREGLMTFQGVKRRFEYQYQSDTLVYIDDYAHHPTEIKALIASIRLLYPNQRITGVFQPHLFTRTRDFFEGFVSELSELDEAILLPIYPAREEPIEGITSDALCARLTSEKTALMTREEAIHYCTSLQNGVLVTIGAGDIDTIIEPLKKALNER